MHSIQRNVLSSAGIASKQWLNCLKLVLLRVGLLVNSVVTSFPEENARQYNSSGGAVGAGLDRALNSGSSSISRWHRYSTITAKNKIVLRYYFLEEYDHRFIQPLLLPNITYPK